MHARNAPWRTGGEGRTGCASFRGVNRNVQIAVLLLMVALVPIRAFAAVTTGFCAFAHEHGAPAQHAAQQHDSHDHDGPAHAGDTCSTCAEHCSSASFLAAAVAAPLVAVTTAQRSVLQERFAAGFVPDHLDPPPLVR